MKILRALAILISLFSMALFPFRNLINNLYVGEPFDTRLMIVVHEHWFWVFKGLRDYNDLRIFYPYKNTLGYTDGFLFDGFIYSILRYFQFSILQAYNLTNIVVLFISNIGLFLVLSFIIKNKYLNLILIFLVSNGYSLVAYLHLWPNILGYLLISWPILFLIKIHQQNKVNLYLNLLLLFVPIYALSYWYPTFFFISFICMLSVTALFFKKFRNNLILNAKIISNKINYKILFALSPLWLTLWILFIKIFVKNSLNVRRDINEILYGPTLNDIFSTKLLGGSIFQPIYEFLRLDRPISNDYKFYDWLVGFSPLLFLIFLVVIYMKKLTLFDKILIWSIFIVFTIFTNFNGSGIYIYLYNQFEIFRVIRVPSRFNLYISIAMLILIFRYLDSQLAKLSLKNLIWLAVPLILIIDNFRVAPGRWNDKEFINFELKNLKSEIFNKCEYFSVTNPGAGHWSDTMDAMVLSAITNVPTLNGYSGTSPEDGIQKFWSDPSEIEVVKDYVKRQKLNNKGCIVSNDGVTAIVALMPTNILSDSEVFLWEKDRSSYWAWQVTSKTNFKIRVDELLDSDFKLIIEPPSCLNGKFEINIFSTNWRKTYDLASGSKINVSGREFNLEKNEIDFEINTNFPGCYVENDPRQLFYKIVLPRDY